MGAARARPGGAPYAWVWGVRGRALCSPDRPSFGACGRGPLPTLCGCSVRAWGPGCPWHLLPCRSSSCVVRASWVCGTRWPLWLGTCPCAVVVAGGVPPWRAWWPRVGVPHLVRSGCSLCSGWLSRHRGAFPHPGGCCPRLYWVAAQGTWRPGENWAYCPCRCPLRRQGRWARSTSYPFGAPRWRCPWRVRLASVWGCVRCGGLACVDPVTYASGLLYRPSFDGGLGRCTGAVLCGRRRPPISGRRMQGPGPPRVCVRALPGLVRQAGLPGLFCCASPFLWPYCPSSLFGPLQAGVARTLFLFGLFFSCLSPPLSRPRCLRLFVLPGPGCPGPWRSAFAPTPRPFFVSFLLFFVPLFCFGVLRFLPRCAHLPRPAFLCFLSLSLFFFFGMFLLHHHPRGTVCCCFWCPGPWRFVVPPPRFSSPRFFFALCSSFFLPPPRASLVSAFPLFSAAGALGLGALYPPTPPAVSLSLPLSLSLVFLSFSFLLLFCPPAFPLFWVLLVLLASAPPGWVPFSFSVRGRVCGVCAACWGCRLCRFLLVLPCCFFRAGWCCMLLPVVAGCSLLGVVARCCFPLAFLGAGDPAWPRGPAPCCVLWFVVASRPPVLTPLFCGSVLPCGVVLWCPAVRLALFCGRCGAVLLLGAVCGAFCCFLSCCVLCPRHVALCCALPRFWRCLVLGVAARVCWWVCLPCFAFWWRVSALVSLSGLWPPVLLSGVLVRCPAVSCALCCVPWCRAALWCCTIWPCLAFVCAAGFCFSICPLFLCKNPLLFLRSLENFRINKKKCLEIVKYTLPNSRTQAGSNTKVTFLSYVLPRDLDDGGLRCKGLTAFSLGPVA